MEGLGKAAWWLVVIGALNSGLVAINVGWDVIGLTGSTVARVIWGLVGLSGLYLLVTMGKK